MQSKMHSLLELFRFVSFRFIRMWKSARVFSIHEFVISWLTSVASNWIYRRKMRSSSMKSQHPCNSNDTKDRLKTRHTIWMSWSVQASQSTRGSEIESFTRHLRSSLLYQFQGFCATISITHALYVHV